MECEENDRKGYQNKPWKVFINLAMEYTIAFIFNPVSTVWKRQNFKAFTIFTLSFVMLDKYLPCSSDFFSEFNIPSLDSIKLTHHSLKTVSNVYIICKSHIFSTLHLESSFLSQIKWLTAVTDTILN